MKKDLLTFLFIYLLAVLNTAIAITPNTNIYEIESPQRLDLTGDVGFDGRDGANGLELNCNNSGQVLMGRNGADGASGETGDKGGDVYIFNDDIKKLSFLTLLQEGGAGGHGGLAGEPSTGCNGGIPGLRGTPGAPGKKGQFGNVYLLASNFEVPTVNSTRLLSLKELAVSPIELTVNTWKKNFGLRQLVTSGSKTKNYYYTFDKTQKYKIRLVWSALVAFEDFTPTKLAISVAKNKLEIKTYTGGLLQYSIVRTAQGFDILVHKVLQEYEVRNLRLKKIKYHGQHLTLGIQEKFRPDVNIKTKFVISVKLIEKYKGTHSVAFYEIPRSLVILKPSGYILEIGKLRMPDEVKALGAKIKIQLTVYREVRGQVRVQGLEGVFKI